MVGHGPYRFRPRRLGPCGLGSIRFSATWFRPIRFRPGSHPYLRAHHRSRTNTLISLDRLGGNKHSRPALVHRGKLCAVLRRALPQFHLRPHRRSVRSAIGCNFSSRWAYIDSMRSAVIAHPVVDHCLVDDDHITLVHIGDMHIADVVHGSVVGKVVPAPVAALVTDAHIAKAIVDAAIEADIAAPVSVMESVAPSGITPVSGRPECSLIRRLCPCAWNPVVATRTPTPISRRPEVSRSRNRRLLILRHRRRRLGSVLIGRRIVICI